MEELGFLLAVPGTVGAFFTLRKFYRWWRPVQIRIFFRSSVNNPEEVGAVITNVSNEAQGLRRFCVRGVYPIRTALWGALKKPSTPLKSYRICRYVPVSFNLLRRESRRLEPKQQRELTYPLYVGKALDQVVFATGVVLVEAQLVGRRRRFRSKRMSVPEKWRFRPMTPSRDYRKP